MMLQQIVGIVSPENFKFNNSQKWFLSFRGCHYKICFETESLIFSLTYKDVHPTRHFEQWTSIRDGLLDMWGGLDNCFLHDICFQCDECAGFFFLPAWYFYLPYTIPHPQIFNGPSLRVIHRGYGSILSRNVYSLLVFFAWSWRPWRSTNYIAYENLGRYWTG